MCDAACYCDTGISIDSETDDEVWHVDQRQEDLMWALNEAWGIDMPDNDTLKQWENSDLKYADVFDTRTLFREFGIRGRGKLRVNGDDWKLLTESAHQYAEMYNLSIQNITCCMGKWYFKSPP